MDLFDIFESKKIINKKYKISLSTIEGALTISQKYDLLNMIDYIKRNFEKTYINKNDRELFNGTQLSCNSYITFECCEEEYIKFLLAFYFVFENILSHINPIILHLKNNDYIDVLYEYFKTNYINKYDCNDLILLVNCSASIFYKHEVNNFLKKYRIKLVNFYDGAAKLNETTVLELSVLELETFLTVTSEETRCNETKTTTINIPLYEPYLLEFFKPDGDDTNDY